MSAPSLVESEARVSLCTVRAKQVRTPPICHQCRAHAPMLCLFFLDCNRESEVGATCVANYVQSTPGFLLIFYFAPTFSMNALMECLLLEV